MSFLDILNDNIVLFAMNDILLSTKEKFCNKPLKNYLLYHMTSHAPHFVMV